MSNLEEAFAQHWRTLTPSGTAQPVREYVPLPGRRYHVDFCWPDLKIVVEIDGGQRKPGGGRHNQDSDREKINLLVLAGWRVLRYSGEMVTNDPVTMVNQVMALVLGVKYP